jgi:GNAT superfamily N-acetyltransferase
VYGVEPYVRRSRVPCIVPTTLGSPQCRADSVLRRFGLVTSVYRVRAARLADLASVLAVLSENGSGESPDWVDPTAPVPSASQIAMWERIEATPDVTVYVAEDDSGAVGTACLSVLPNITYDCRPSAFIEAVVVKYEHRRRGLARTIMRHVLQDAGLAGCYKVQLLTHKRHATDGAHDLYRSLGFIAEAEGFRLYLSS